MVSINVIICISTVVTAIATVILAIYARINAKLTNEIRSQDGNFKEAIQNMTINHHKELSDLYQALVISTLISGNSDSSVVYTAITTFKGLYTGTTKIFNK